MIEGIIVLIAAAVLFLIFLYNRFIKLKNMADEAWSGIDVQLKRRYDLIPNLAACVEGYATHEKETLAKVVELRNTAMKASSVSEKSKADNALSESLKSVFALSEAYPDLKANQNFLDLQKQLGDIEDTLQNARRYYNATVRDYNIAAESFPSCLIAKQFGFEKKDFFEAAENEKEAVKVSFK